MTPTPNPAEDVTADPVAHVEFALSFYAERRNHFDLDSRDAFDGDGPGARARAVLANWLPQLLSARADAAALRAALAEARRAGEANAKIVEAARELQRKRVKMFNGYAGGTAVACKRATIALMEAIDDAALAAPPAARECARTRGATPFDCKTCEGGPCDITPAPASTGGKEGEPR